jgi:hypothetical protein
MNPERCPGKIGVLDDASRHSNVPQNWGICQRMLPAAVPVLPYSRALAYKAPLLPSWPSLLSAIAMDPLAATPNPLLARIAAMLPLQGRWGSCGGCLPHHTCNGTC